MMKNTEDIKAWDIRSEPKSINSSIEMIKSSHLGDNNLEFND